MSLVKHCSLQAIICTQFLGKFSSSYFMVLLQHPLGKSDVFYALSLSILVPKSRGS